jgi:hypothetical protein
MVEKLELQDRMAKTVKGQVSWADPEKGMKCISCKHLSRVPPHKIGADKRLAHRCDLVKLHSKKDGAAFNGNLAIACSMFAM